MKRTRKGVRLIFSKKFSELFCINVVNFVFLQKPITKYKANSKLISNGGAVFAETLSVSDNDDEKTDKVDSAAQAIPKPLAKHTLKPNVCFF